MSEPTEPTPGLLDRIKGRRHERQRVQVNAFGETLFVHELGPRDSDRLELFRAKIAKGADEDEARETFTACWVMATTHDADGRQVFGYGDPREPKDLGELPVVLGLPARDVKRVYKLAARLNGLGEDDEGDAGN